MKIISISCFAFAVVFAWIAYELLSSGSVVGLAIGIFLGVMAVLYLGLSYHLRPQDPKMTLS